MISHCNNFICVSCQIADRNALNKVTYLGNVACVVLLVVVVQTGKILARLEPNSPYYHSPRQIY